MNASKKLLNDYPRLRQVLLYLTQDQNPEMTEPVEPFSDDMYGSVYPKPTEDELKELYSKCEELLKTIPEDRLREFAFADSEQDEKMEELEVFLNSYYLELP